MLQTIGTNTGRLSGRMGAWSGWTGEAFWMIGMNCAISGRTMNTPKIIPDHGTVGTDLPTTQEALDIPPDNGPTPCRVWKVVMVVIMAGTGGTGVLMKSVIYS